MLPSFLGAGIGDRRVQITVPDADDSCRQGVQRLGDAAEDAVGQIQIRQGNTDDPQRFGLCALLQIPVDRRGLAIA